MKKCWAVALGGCGGGFSKEHIFSRGLFTGKAVSSLGWILGSKNPISIGVNSLTSNILCERHNNSLSEVDTEGITAFHAIRRFESLLSGKNYACDKKEFEHIVDGYLLERWFLKHAINLFVVNGNEKRWVNGNESGQPPLQLVQAAFGLSKLQKPFGLYNYAGIQNGQRKVIADQIEFIPLYIQGNLFAGAKFEFQALSFIIWFGNYKGTSCELPWEKIREFYHHMGGSFESPPLQAHFRVKWDL